MPVDKITVTDLNYDFNDVPVAKFQAFQAGGNGQPYYNVNFSVEINLGANIEFRIVLGNIQRAAVPINYV